MPAKTIISIVRIVTLVEAWGLEKADLALQTIQDHDRMKSPTNTIRPRTGQSPIASPCLVRQPLRPARRKAQNGFT
jgi:hypothetical protein